MDKVTMISTLKMLNTSYRNNFDDGVKEDIERLYSKIIVDLVNLDGNMKNTCINMINGSYFNSEFKAKLNSLIEDKLIVDVSKEEDKLFSNLEESLTVNSPESIRVWFNVYSYFIKNTKNVDVIKGIDRIKALFRKYNLFENYKDLIKNFIDSMLPVLDIKSVKSVSKSNLNEARNIVFNPYLSRYGLHVSKDGLILDNNNEYVSYNKLRSIIYNEGDKLDSVMNENNKGLV